MRYSKQLDHMILAVHYAMRGKKRKAAKALQQVLDGDPRETRQVLASLAKDQSRAFRQTGDYSARGSRFVGEVAEFDNRRSRAELAFLKKKKHGLKGLKRRARVNIRAL